MELNSLKEIKSNPITRQYTFTIQGLPDNATEQEAVNQMLKDLHKDNTIDIEEISDGRFTFKQLHDQIQNLTKQLSYDQ